MTIADKLWAVREKELKRVLEEKIDDPDIPHAVMYALEKGPYVYTYLHSVTPDIRLYVFEDGSLLGFIAPKQEFFTCVRGEKHAFHNNVRGIDITGWGWESLSSENWISEYEDGSMLVYNRAYDRFFICDLPTRRRLSNGEYDNIAYRQAEEIGSSCNPGSGAPYKLAKELRDIEYWKTSEKELAERNTAIRKRSNAAIKRGGCP